MILYFPFHKNPEQKRTVFGCSYFFSPNPLQKLKIQFFPRGKNRNISDVPLVWWHCGRNGTGMNQGLLAESASNMCK